MVIIVIPLEGCGSCVENSINYIKNNPFNDNVFFIISSLYKDRLSEFGDNKLNNCYLDTLKISNKNNMVLRTPKAYGLNRGVIERIINLEYANDYGDLELFLKDVV